MRLRWYDVLVQLEEAGRDRHDELANRILSQQERADARRRQDGGGRALSAERGLRQTGARFTSC
jgi:hypothetical protein